MNVRTYKYVPVALARRPMGTDSGAFPRGTHSGQPPRPQARPHAWGPGSGLVDSEHRGPMAPAAAVLPQLQDGASPVPTVVRARSPARDPDAAGEYAA